MRLSRVTTERQSSVVLRLPWWLVTTYALLNAVAVVNMILGEDSGPWMRGAAIIAVLVATCGWLAELKGYRSHWWSVLFEVVAILLVAIALAVPDRAKGLLFSVASRRGLCASSRATASVGVLATSLVFMVAVTLHHTVFFPHPASTYVESVSSLPGLFIAAATNRMLIEGLDARARAEAAQRRMASHDVLTGLANRRLFLETTEAALGVAASSHQPMAVLLLDLDAFKTVNDTLGHASGDTLLVEVGKRLRESVHDPTLLARLGGDEFAIILGSSGQAAAWEAAAQVLAAFDRPVRLAASDTATREVRVRISLGAVVVEPDCRTDAHALLRDADMAMYEAKRSGGHRCVVFKPALLQRLKERVSLESALREAMNTNGLYLEYQPCVDLATREIASTEALLRWRDPERGVISPGNFIPIAEETGMIVPIGRWALAEACQQASGWHTAAGQLTVAVNLSPRQLTDPQLLDDIQLALDRTGLPSACLVLELTESELADEDTLPVLRRLKDLGVRLAVDDFGTGYSCLAYLRQFPLDILKIDRQFVTQIATSPSAAALTRSIIDMAHTLGLETVAEGVETPEQAQLLQKMDCRRAQGFLFSRPKPPEDITAHLMRQ